MSDALKVTIELCEPHRHAGRDYPAGGTLELPKRKADWLIGTKRAKAVTGETPEPASVAPATPKKTVKE